MTPKQRRVLIERIARELSWYGETPSAQGSYRARAAHVVDNLTRDAFEGATLRRAVDRLAEIAADEGAA